MPFTFKRDKKKLFKLNLHFIWIQIDLEPLITLLKLQNSSVPCEMSDYEIRRPTHVNDIASIVYDLSQMLIEPGENVPSGIYQWCGLQPLTKYDMVKSMAKVFNLDGNHVKGVKEPSPGAPRPFDTTMDTSRLEDLNISCHTPFEKGIEECLQKWRN